MRGVLRLVLAGALTLAAGEIARADDALKAKIGVLRLSSSAPVFIAQDKGYFKETGLDIELKFFDAAQPVRAGEEERAVTRRATWISASPLSPPGSTIWPARAR